MHYYYFPRCSPAWTTPREPDQRTGAGARCRLEGHHRAGPVNQERAHIVGRFLPCRRIWCEKPQIIAAVQHTT